MCRKAQVTLNEFEKTDERIRAVKAETTQTRTRNQIREDELDAGVVVLQSRLYKTYHVHLLRTACTLWVNLPSQLFAIAM